ncbi:MAG: ATP-binding protein [Candidatus Neomarinimicrobiota bacterium]
MGLGMPIIKNIMEEHHGGFEIKSKVGQGTNVTLWLPILKLGEKG